jgi:hypothetical protein
MGKLKFMIFEGKTVAVIVDSLRAYVALRTEEYHTNPSVQAALHMDAAIETLEYFTHPKKPKSEIKCRIERIKAK